MTIETAFASASLAGGPRRRRSGFPRRGDPRGSVLVVALLVAALIALALGSYLNLNLTSARLAQRSFRHHAAFNLAEAGAEEALWSFNQTALKSPDAWNEWTRDGGAAWRKINGFDFGANAKGSVKVYVDNVSPPSSTRPKIVSLSSVESPGQSPVTKMIEITLARRSPFANGLMARDSITFNGGRATVDSWDSDPDRDPSTPSVPYSTPVRNDRGSVASASVLNTAALLNNAVVWGYVSTGRELPQVGPTGLVGPFGTTTGTVDPSRVSTDFVAEFPVATAPEDGTVISSFGPALGTLGTATSWRSSHLRLSGNNTLTILGDVTLVLTAGPGIDALAISGNASIVIPQGSSLRIYTEGDVRIAGNGVINENAAPAQFQLWGVATRRHAVDVVGNARLRSVLHAPNADVSIKGNATVEGSIVAHSITLNGNVEFHYDEALAHWGDGQPFGVSHWRSLSEETERRRYLEIFDRF